MITIVNALVQKINHDLTYRNDNNEIVDETKIYHDAR